jgi:hypothetical protein
MPGFCPTAGRRFSGAEGDEMTWTYRYYIKGNDPDNYYKFKSVYDAEDGTYLASEAAKNYHYHHDGWENTFPLTFVISDYEGYLIGVYEVERDVEPVFHATEVKI